MVFRMGEQSMKCYLAVDIGASSGRHIVGWKEGEEIHTEEVYRFPNGVFTENGHLCWGVDRLFKEVMIGLKKAFEKYPGICSMSLDTWAVDYVLMKEKKLEYPCYAYRDDRTDQSVSLVHEKIPFSELYSRTGCQFQSFNTIYQLYWDKLQGRLEGVTDFLMLPEYLLYRLSGVKAREYTNAKSTGLVNAETEAYDEEIIHRLGLPEHLFPNLSQPGTVLGSLLPQVAEAVGGNCQVVLCATHDTASAVEGIPMEENAPYISSGTWSLLGVKTTRPLTDKNSMEANYSNEGGVGYNRYQKNIMGMWLVNSLKKELCPNLPFEDIVKAAEESSYDGLVDANGQQFLAPESMKTAFDQSAPGSLQNLGDYFRCAYRSLAVSYRDAMNELETNTGTHYDQLYIVGGGAKNKFLNRLTEEFTGKKVIALPLEATALGNLKIQMEA